MMGDITIGQYVPGNSLLHRLDPRMKLVLTLLFIVLVFLPQNWWGILLVVSFMAVIVALSRLPLRLMWRSIKPILFLVAITAVLKNQVRQGEPAHAYLFSGPRGTGKTSTAKIMACPFAASQPPFICLTSVQVHMPPPGPDGRCIFSHLLLGIPPWILYYPLAQ